MESIETIIKRIEEFCRNSGETEEPKLKVKSMINGQYPVWQEGVGWAYSFLREYHSHGVLTDSVRAFNKERTDEKAQDVRRYFQDYLDMCRVSGLTPTPNQYFQCDREGRIGIITPLSQILTEEQVNEYILSYMIIQQGNGRFVPINASPSTFREKFGRFTNSRFSVEENFLFALVENLNIDNSYPAGAAPILYDPILRAAYPADTQKIAELYRDMLSEEIEKSPIPWKVDQDREILSKLSTFFRL